MPKATRLQDNIAKTADENGTARAENSEEDTAGLLQTIQGHVGDVRSLIQCAICVRPLFEPFMLACGHTFCYSCLSTWFASGRSNKTCPDCRAPVKAQPAPAYLVRTIVQLFTSRPELLGKGETLEEHAQTQRDEAEIVDTDKKNEDPREGGLFRGTFKPRMPVLPPVVDLEDGVVRCPQCSWELEGASGCEHCGYRQEDEEASDDESAQWSDPENSEMTDYYDDEADEADEVEDGFEDDENDGLDYGPSIGIQLPGFLGGGFFSGWRPDPQTIDDSEGEEGEEDEADEDDYLDEDMDSFIDDDEHVDEHEYGSQSDRSTVMEGLGYNTQDQYDESQMGPGFPSSEIPTSPQHGDSECNVDMENQVSMDEDEDEEGEEDEDEDDPVNDGGAYGEDEDDDDEGPIRPAMTGQRRHPSAPTGNFRRGNAGISAHNPLHISSDDYRDPDGDDDSDEEPVAAGRTTRSRPRGSYF